MLLIWQFKAISDSYDVCLRVYAI